MSTPIEKRFDRLFVKFIKTIPANKVQGYSPYDWVLEWTFFVAKEMKILMKLEEE